MERYTMQARQTKAVRRGSRFNTARQPLKPRNSARNFVVGSGLLCLATLVSLVGNYDQVSHFVNRPVIKVRLENELRHIDEAEVRGALQPYMGSGFFDFDVAAVKRDLEARPWVGTALVTRIWPDSVSLRLVEEVAIARWGETGVLNQRGRIFTPQNIDALSTLPQLTGPADSQAMVMRQYQQISELLFPTGLRLTALSLSQRGSWTLSINESFQVVVGRDQVMARLRRFLDFYNGQSDLQTADIKSVDLRYDNGIAVDFNKQEIAEVAVR